MKEKLITLRERAKKRWAERPADKDFSHDIPAEPIMPEIPTQLSWLEASEFPATPADVTIDLGLGTAIEIFKHVLDREMTRPSQAKTDAEDTA